VTGSNEMDIVLILFYGFGFVLHVCTLFQYTTTKENTKRSGSLLIEFFFYG